MFSRRAGALLAAMTVMLLTLVPLSNTARAAIDCTVNAYSWAVLDGQTQVRIYGRADASCNASTVIDVGVQLVITTDGNPNGKPINSQNFSSCYGSQCGVDAPPSPSPGLGPFANGTWGHARGSVSWDDNGTQRSKPFSLGTWKCTQHPFVGMGPVAGRMGQLFAMRVGDDQGLAVIARCSSQIAIHA